MQLVYVMFQPGAHCWQPASMHVTPPGKVPKTLLSIALQGWRQSFNFQASLHLYNTSNSWWAVWLPENNAGLMHKACNMQLVHGLMI